MSVNWDVDVKDLTDKQLKDLHGLLHQEYDPQYKEQYYNLHKRVVHEMEEREIEHKVIDDLDQIKLKLNVNIDKLKEWNEDSSYFFGWLSCDGSIIETDINSRVSFQLRPDDEYILKHFKTFLDFTGDIYFTREFPYSTLAINNDDLVQHLKELGLKPEKEVSPDFIQNIPDKVFNHYVRGTFDANGSFSWTDQGLIARVAGHESTMRAIFSRLKNKDLNVHWFDADRTQGFSLYDSYAIEFAKWLYDNSEIYLKRKRDVIKNKLYVQPKGSGEESGRTIELKEILSHITEGDISISKPYVLLTGGLVNSGKSKNDIDILIKGSESDTMSMPAEFRILRMLPKELWNRVQFIYDNEQKSIGPFTSHVPLFDLELKLRKDLSVVEMSQLEFEEADKSLDLYLVGAEKKPYSNTFEGVMLNAYTTKSKESLKPWIDEYQGKIMLDNGAFQDKTLTPEELAERTREIEPEYVVAPDDIFSIDSHKKTLEATEEFLNQDLPEKTKVIGVPQGQSVKLYEKCLKEMIELEPDSIGLGRKSMQVAQYPGKHFQQRLVCLDRLEQEGILGEIRDKGIELHSLGISNPHEFKYLNYYGFTSADSMSYMFSAMYKQLPLVNEPDERPVKFDVDGNVEEKELDNNENYMYKQEMIKKFLALESLDEKYEFVLNQWKPIRKLKATEKHIEHHVKEHRGFDPDDLKYKHVTK